MMSAFLITLLSISLIAFAVPNISLFSIHPASYLLLISYFFGVRLLTATHKMPMWLPRRTRETRTEKDTTHHYKHRNNKKLWIEFSIYSIVVGSAGFVLSLARASYCNYCCSIEIINFGGWRYH